MLLEVVDEELPVLLVAPLPLELLLDVVPDGSPLVQETARHSVTTEKERLDMEDIAQPPWQMMTRPQLSVRIEPAGCPMHGSCGVQQVPLPS